MTEKLTACRSTMKKSVSYEFCKEMVRPLSFRPLQGISNQNNTKELKKPIMHPLDTLQMPLKKIYQIPNDNLKKERPTT